MSALGRTQEISRQKLIKRRTVYDDTGVSNASSESEASDPEGATDDEVDTRPESRLVRKYNSSQVAVIRKRLWNKITIKLRGNQRKIIEAIKAYERAKVAESKMLAKSKHVKQVILQVRYKTYAKMTAYNQRWLKMGKRQMESSRAVVDKAIKAYKVKYEKWRASAISKYVNDRALALKTRRDAKKRLTREKELNKKQIIFLRSYFKQYMRSVKTQMKNN